MNRAWADAPADLFAALSQQQLLGELASRTQFAAELAQIEAWKFTIRHLQALAVALPGSHVFMEFSIPRMGRRADAVIVAGPLVFVLEYKVGERGFPRHAIEQVHGYALDLKNFHVTSHDKPIVPILISSEAPPQQLGLGFWAPDRVHEPLLLAPEDVLPTIQRLLATGDGPEIAATAWADGAYRPTPNIIEAAEALYAGHDVIEISRSEAGAENLSRTATAVERVVDRARKDGHKAICFVTGVPGAGKTLAGLNIACSRNPEWPEQHAVFLSGNGPLVEVLQEALRRDGKRKRALPDLPEARIVQAQEPRTFIQNVHHFRDEYLGPDQIPPEHVVIFDEAQRAWDSAMTSDFMRRKRGQHGFDQSEPAFLLSVMDRRPDWCVVVCLIGEGQEINRGEAGVAEWIRALQADLPDWQIFLPPHLMSDDGPLDAGLRWHLGHRTTTQDADLHLATSVRSFRAGRVSAFVAALLDEDTDNAEALRPDPTQFPIWQTRELATARRWLRKQRRAGERAGLLASSNALRLKPEGLHVKAPIDVCHWFLNGNDDVRASNALEDAATEFAVQGLELDWTCVAWDLNLRREGGWQAREFRGTKWQAIRTSADGFSRADYVKNAYRVLLTRARQGMVIFVPRGDAADATRPPAEYDAIAEWLSDCGIPSLP
ncbi:DUF2075 domain-containing protein [Sandarakinorhabdus sp.]|uniref:DUF2075 domain-containing protein n=1 Tax=Sandarakinorhabdus sp. TaxID=1916663 RepID=UPI003F714634